MTDLLSLDEYRGKHKGETIIVCGTGPSVRTLAALRAVMDYRVVIGVNDFMGIFDPTYLVLVDKFKTFSETRQRLILAARDACDAIFAQDANDLHEHLSGGRAKTVHIRPQVHIVTNRVTLKGEHPVYTAVTSTYTAISLAAAMGASRIGLIGADFTGHARLEKHMPRIETHYKEMAKACEQAGILLLNLSARSLLRSVRKGTFDDLDEALLPQKS